MHNMVIGAYSRNARQVHQKKLLYLAVQAPAPSSPPSPAVVALPVHFPPFPCCTHLDEVS